MSAMTVECTEVVNTVRSAEVTEYYEQRISRLTLTGSSLPSIHSQRRPVCVSSF